jgi:hypothetical protein
LLPVTVDGVCYGLAVEVGNELLLLHSDLFRESDDDVAAEACAKMIRRLALRKGRQT